MSSTESRPPSIDFAALKSLVQSKFLLLDAFVEEPYGLPTFHVSAEPARERFRLLVNELAQYGFVPALRKQADRLVIRIMPRPTFRRPRRLLNIILLFVTAATVYFASYVTIHNLAGTRVGKIIFSSLDLNMQISLVAASIFAIIGLHELGHKVAARIHRLDSTLPYFIPGPPPFGTFGAVISLRSPPINRDQLFDLGFSGPLLGFIATLAVAMLSPFAAPLVNQRELARLVQEGLVNPIGWPNTPLLLDLVLSLQLRPVPAGYTLVNLLPGSVAFAAQVGALITFLNILPVWQLDGGHISRATFGRDGHLAATMVGFAVLIFARYWFFAIFLLFLMMGSRGTIYGVEPLDDVSPLSRWRKIAYMLAIAILALSFVIFS